MIQDGIFASHEGDNWYQRNRLLLDDEEKKDWPLFLLDQIKDRGGIRSVLELGCSNGYRLARLKRTLLPEARCVGLDASQEAIEQGLQCYPDLELHQGVLAESGLAGEFDLVIVNFVLHWVDRSTLARSIAAIDQLVRDGGLLILGDFLPDYQQRRRYHHLPDAEVYTYKQDYSKIFTSLGLYQELVHSAYNHDQMASYQFGFTRSEARASCSLLYKSVTGFYPEV